MAATVRNTDTGWFAYLVRGQIIGNSLHEPTAGSKSNMGWDAFLANPD